MGDITGLWVDLNDPTGTYLRITNSATPGQFDVRVRAGVSERPGTGTYDQATRTWTFTGFPRPLPPDATGRYTNPPGPTSFDILEFQFTGRTALNLFRSQSSIAYLSMADMTILMCPHALGSYFAIATETFRKIATQALLLRPHLPRYRIRVIWPADPRDQTIKWFFFPYVGCPARLTVVEISTVQEITDLIEKSKTFPSVSRNFNVSGDGNGHYRLPIQIRSNIVIISSHGWEMNHLLFTSRDLQSVGQQAGASPGLQYVLACPPSDIAPQAMLNAGILRALANNGYKGIMPGSMNLIDNDEAERYLSYCEIPVYRRFSILKHDAPVNDLLFASTKEFYPGTITGL